MTHQTLDLVGHNVVPGRGYRCLGEQGFQQRIAQRIRLCLDQQGIWLTRYTGYGDLVSFRNLQEERQR